MAAFADHVLAQLHDPAAMTALLTGAPAATYPRLVRLVDEVYETEGVELDRITGATVLSVRPEHRLTAADRVALTWTQAQPSHLTADLRGLVERVGAEVWADLYVTVLLDVVAALDPGGVESAVTRAIDDVTSLADFRSRFRYLDLDDFLARRRISTVEQLRASAEYVLAEVRLRPAPPFDPADPANARTITLDVALAVLDDRDLVGGLRAARRLRAAGAAGPPGRADPTLGRPVRPFAVAVVLPATAPAGQPDDTAVDSLYASAGVLPLFASPP
ncbi:hypothetical protein [Cellulomonas fengjieae]|uniref:Uncharacterized protein n=1 Tax=Cellulomonas fengjieae TaxID=2819978 RepID=A0ABS3SIS1_9CELL|nr:hypothetical protein [Cellulomonas fengjieae]MBO3084860.1 hypothetical protein [Cellulomonas fengjieae]QVI66826.1 hypothetical protein KG102_04355 [Cellulomonas fengjieae]